MKNISFIFFSLFLLVSLSSCWEGVTDGDKPKLIEEAKTGNLRAIEHVHHYCDVPDDVKQEYEKILLENGNAYILNRKYVDEARNHSTKDADNKIRRKWALRGAELGNVDDVLWLYEHADNQEDKLKWKQLLIDKGYGISPEVTDDKKNAHLFDFSHLLVKHLWNFCADGTWFAKVNVVLSHLVSHTVVSSVAMFFQPNWWEGLIGIAILIAFLVFAFKAIFSHKGFVQEWNGSYKQWAFPFLWNMLYATLNGGIIIICMIGSLTGSWWTDIPDGVLNIGSFSRIPGTSSLNVDAAILFSWVWLIGMVGYLLYFVYNNYDKDKNELLTNIGILLAAIVSGYIIGICLSLLTIIAIAYLVYLFASSLGSNPIGSSSSSSSSSARQQREEEQSREGIVSYDGEFITDGNGRSTRITDVDSNGIRKDDQGNHWREGVGGKLHKIN